ncbi:MAG: 4Fe-4S binding protein [Fusobacteriota bacterium]
MDRKDLRKILLQTKSHQEWSWAIIVGFFSLGIINYWFGLIGLACISLPLIHALKGKGRIHCSHYCPRGSFFGKFLSKLSLNNALPNFMRTKRFKHILLGVMVVMFSFSMYHTGGNPYKIGFALFRFLLISSILGVVLGIFFKPRSWCQVCPMGHASYVVGKARQKVKAKKDKKIS